MLFRRIWALIVGGMDLNSILADWHWIGMIQTQNWNKLRILELDLTTLDVVGLIWILVRLREV